MIPGVRGGLISASFARDLLPSMPEVVPRAAGRRREAGVVVAASRDDARHRVERARHHRCGRPAAARPARPVSRAAHRSAATPAVLHVPRRLHTAARCRHRLGRAARARLALVGHPGNCQRCALVRLLQWPRDTAGRCSPHLVAANTSSSTARCSGRSRRHNCSCGRWCAPRRWRADRRSSTARWTCRVATASRSAASSATASSRRWRCSSARSAAGKRRAPMPVLFEQSLTVLYRVLFLLFAEARGLAAAVASGLSRSLQPRRHRHRAAAGTAVSRAVAGRSGDLAAGARRLLCRRASRHRLQRPAVLAVAGRRVRSHAASATRSWARRSSR